MGFAMGSKSCFLDFPIHNSLFSNPPSQPFFLINNANVHKHKKHKTAMVCMHQENAKDSNFCRRKAIIFMGFAVLPLLKLKTQAADAFVAEDSGQGSQDQKQRGEQTSQGIASSNPFLSLLNGLGIFGAGVLGALYAFAQKEKAASDATIESMRSKLKEKEAAIQSMQKKFEAELLNEKETRNRELKKANEDRQSLVNQLTSANGTITDLEKELEKERVLVKELKFQIDNLQNNLKKAGEEKIELQEILKEKLNSIEVLQGRINLLTSEVKNKEDDLQRLSSTFVEKEKDLSNLNSIYQQSQDQLRGLESEMKALRNELLKYKTELEVKNATVNDMNVQVTSLHKEREEMNQTLDIIQTQYNELKGASEKKEASDAKLLEEKELKLNQLEEQLKFAHEEGSKNKMLVADLTHERDDIKKMLDIELNNVRNLDHELQLTQVTSEKAKAEASDLAKQLQQSRNLCSELETELSKVRVEFAEARESSQRNVDEAKKHEEVLAGEVASAKELLKIANEELQIMSQKLAAVTEDRDNKQKELADALKKAEAAIHDLKEEKKSAGSLDNELKTLEAQILKDKEARRFLEANLDEATKSLDEMNRNALTLSKDLELANSQISSLEDEKDALHKTLSEQKQISREARENLEDAHNLVMRLGEERETLEKKAQKLEEDLASAKGEILRLRSQINSSRTPVNDERQQKVDAGNSNKVGAAKRTNKRRKGVSTQDDSS